MGLRNVVAKGPFSNVNNGRDKICIALAIYVVFFDWLMNETLTSLKKFFF